MQIAFHIGANCTNTDLLLKSVLANATSLMQQGVAIPGPGKYRALLRETIQQLGSAHPPPDARDILIDAIVEEEHIQRIVLSNDNFITIPKRIFHEDGFYPQAGTKLRGLYRLFPDDDLRLFFSIRNPVSFLQEAFQLSQAHSLRDYLGLLHPRDMRWSDVLERMRRASPDIPITVWCTEDTPVIWEDLIRQLSDLADAVPVAGKHDMISRIITDAGKDALARIDPALDRPSRHNALADVIETYGRPEALNEEIDLPDLDQDLIAAMTQGYEEDLAVIDQMDNVKLLLPFR